MACGSHQPRPLAPISLGVYTRPSSGYLTAWPQRSLGTDLIKALHLVGAKAGEPHHAWGWLVWPDGGTPIALSAMDDRPARAIAYDLAKTGTAVTLARAVGRGRVTLYERAERLETMEKLAALADGAVRLVAPNGVLLMKTIVPRVIDELMTFAYQVSGLLQTADRKVMQPAIVNALEQMGDAVNWKNPTPAQMELAWARAKGVLVGASRALMPVWEETLTTSFTDVADANRATLRQTYLPRLGTTMRQPDQRAIAQMGTQQGWFLRNEIGMRSDALSRKGQQIMQEGLANGMGRTEIAEQLRQELPTLWGAMGKNYSIACASVGVSRARSFSEVASYQEAGIQQMEIVAMLDERTTDICRAMDGQIIPVTAARALIDAGAAVQNPEDISKVNPFLRQTGYQGTSIVTAGGGKIADVLRSGRGKVDDVGVMNFHTQGAGLPGQGIGAPPYHFRCRTMTVPRMSRLIGSPGVPGGEGRAVGLPPSPLPIFPPPKLLPPPVERPIQPLPPPGVVTGLPPAIDRNPFPMEFFGDPGPYAWKMALMNGASVRVYSQNPMSPAAWSPSAWKGEPTLADVVRNPKPIAALTKAPKGDVLVDVCRKGTMLKPEWDANEIMQYATLEGLEGRAAMIRVRASGDRTGEFYIRIEPTAPHAKIRKALEAARLEPDIIGQTDGFLKLGQAEGWLKIGKLAEVSAAQAQRVAVLPPPPAKVKPVKPIKPLPPVVKPPPPPPVVMPPPPPPPKPIPGKPELKPVSVLGGTAAHEVAPPREMARAVGGAGKQVAVRIGGKWELRQELKFEELKLTTSDTHIHVMGGRRIGMGASSSGMDWNFGEILNAERKLAQSVVREYTIRDAKGGTMFVRIDGAALKKMPKTAWQEIDKLSSYAMGDVERKVITDSLKKFGCVGTRDIREFKPGIEIDWSRPGLIPGVPIKEQALARIDAIKAELADQLSWKLEQAGFKPLSEFEASYAINQKREEFVAQTLRDHMIVTNAPRKLKADEGFFDSWQDLPGGVPGVPNAVQQVKDVVMTRIRQFSRYAAEPVLQAITGSTGLPMPTYYTSAGTKKGVIRGFHDEQQNHIVTGENPTDRLIGHETQHWFDRVGYNGPVAQYVRNRHIGTGKVTSMGTKDKPEWALPGKWIEKYEARDYEILPRKGFDRTKKRSAEEWRQLMDEKLDRNIETFTSSEYASMSAQRFLGGPSQNADLVRMYRDSPDQAALFIAQQRGHFVPPIESP